MRRKKSSQRVLTNIKDWIISYLIVLIIPIIICSIFYIYTYLVIWEETNNSNKVALEIVASELDDVFERTFLLEYTIQRNSRIQECVQLSQPLNNQKHLKLVQAAQALDNCIGGEVNIVEQCQIIFPKSEMVLRRGIVYSDLQACYEAIWTKSSYSYVEWKEFVKERHERHIISDSGSKTISYIISLPLFGKGHTMNVIFTLNSTYIQNVLAKMDSVGNSAILLADVNNRILVSRNLEKVNIEDLPEEIEPQEGYERVTIDDKDMMLSCIELENIDLRLISIVPYEEFWSTAIQTLSVFWLALTLCILVGVGAAYFFSVMKQKMWGRFNDILVINTKEKDNKNRILRNKEIAEAIDYVVEEFESMQKKLVSVDKMKRELLISSALRGRIRAEEVEPIFEKNNVNLVIGNYALVLFRLNGFERFYDVEEQGVSEKDILLMKQGIISIIRELVQKDFSYEVLSIDEKIVCIIDFEYLDKEACYDKILHFARKCREITMERLSVLMTISVSDVHKCIFSLQNAYSEASRVMEYQEAMDDKLVMTYMEMVKKTQNGYLYSLEKESALIHWIFEGKEKEAVQFLDEICETNIAYINGSKELIKCFIWNLTASVLRAEEELGNKIAQTDTQELLDSINEEENLFEAKRVLKERIKKLCNEVNMKRGKKGEVIADQIKKYIHESFVDPNLSNTKIASHFGMHENYIATLFREQTGVNLHTYIQKVRLEKAKELLETTDLTLEEISIRIGCTNSLSVNRLFKKYENMTPAVYRKAKRKL